jgi:hypothetical protein
MEQRATVSPIGHKDDGLSTPLGFSLLIET